MPALTALRTPWIGSSAHSGGCNQAGSESVPDYIEFYYLDVPPLKLVVESGYDLGRKCGAIAGILPRSSPGFAAPSNVIQAARGLRATGVPAINEGRPQ